MDAEMMGVIYNQYYSLSDENNPDYKLNSIGWNNSFTGEPYTAEEMSEWRDNTLEIIRNLQPQKVLEVACGTGMMAFGLLEHVSYYMGIDVAEEGIKYIQTHLSKEEAEKSDFAAMQAAEIDTITEHDFDVAFINSATQYMGPEEDFLQIIKKMTKKVRHGGKIFLGDMKAKTLRELFYKTILLWNGSVEGLEEKLRRKEKRDYEFYIDKCYLDSVQEAIPRIRKIELLVKKGRCLTEMNVFRFDAILYLDEYEEVFYREFDCKNKELDDIKEIISESKNEKNFKLNNLENILFKRVMEEKLGESHLDTPAFYIAEICDLIKDAGFDPVVVSDGEITGRYFNIKAVR